MRTRIFAALASLLCVAAGAQAAGPARASGSAAPSFRLVRVASGLSSPVYATSAPGDKRLFVVEQGGTIRTVRNGKVASRPYADLRRSAIEKLGLMGSAQTADALVSLYSGETDKALRKKVIEALFLQGNAKAIVEIYRKETDPELKKKAVEQLSIMNSKEGSKLFQEILDK